MNGRRISTFEGLVTLTLTLTSDRVILHTVVHHSSTSMYTSQISLKSKKVFVDGRTDRHLGPALLGRLCRRVNPKWSVSQPGVEFRN